MQWRVIVGDVTSTYREHTKIVSLPVSHRDACPVCPYSFALATDWLPVNCLWCVGAFQLFPPFTYCGSLSEAKYIHSMDRPSVGQSVMCFSLGVRGTLHLPLVVTIYKPDRQYRIVGTSFQVSRALYLELGPNSYRPSSSRRTRRLLIDFSLESSISNHEHIAESSQMEIQYEQTESRSFCRLC